MEQAIIWINQNTGTTLSIVLIIGLIVIAMLLIQSTRISRRVVERRLIEYERRRQHDSATLVDRLQDDANRAAEMQQRIFEIQQSAMQGTESRISRLSESLEGRQDNIQRTLNERLTTLQGSNEQRLDQMRAMVDEKLTTTLNKRLGESFQQVSEQLERVYKGLGEMQTLAGGVGDLKRVLTGVKTRGIWGEVRLGTLLEQNLTPSQYVVNAQIDPDSSERVEFAIVLPGKGIDSRVLLPIDAKFPQEDYQRLLDATEQGSKEMVEKAALALERAIVEQAKRITSKYIKLPYSTDFAIMFLPSEGLYAEVLRRPGLSESIQQKFRVVLSGPTTLSALLSSLQMGFRTLAVEQRSEEVWRLLGSVKDEFQKFGDVLDKTRQRLEQASNELDSASVRTRAINRKLKAMEQLELESPEEE